MTLRSMIVDHAATVFLNKEHFAEDVVHWRNGDSTDTATVTVIVDWDAEQGEQTGLANKITTDRGGRSTDFYLVIELDIDVTVTTKDRFVITHPTTSTVYVANAVRRVGNDHAMQSWLCVVPNGLDTKHARVRN